MRSSFSMSLLYHAYVYLEFLILACTIYILAPVNVNSTELVVFEAAIDLMSYVDIFADYESNKLALGMLADAPLETFLREHPQITSIRFCLDGDEPGRKAAAELMRKYYELGYEVEDCPPPAGYKDYNEWLVAAKLNLNRMNKRADEPVRA